MAKRRELDHTYITHDLAAEKTTAIQPQHIRMGSVSLSNDICDIVPGIEVDEEKVKMEVRRMSGAGTGGGLLVPGAHQGTQQSAQIELSQVNDLEQDLDEVLLDI